MKTFQRETCIESKQRGGLLAWNRQLTTNVVIGLRTVMSLQINVSHLHIFQNLERGQMLPFDKEGASNIFNSGRHSHKHRCAWNIFRFLVRMGGSYVTGCWRRGQLQNMKLIIGHSIFYLYFNRSTEVDSPRLKKPS